MRAGTRVRLGTKHPARLGGMGEGKEKQGWGTYVFEQVVHRRELQATAVVVLALIVSS